MNDETQNNLQQVYTLIETGDLDAARAVLMPLLERDPDNPDMWWLYAHAVSDPVEAARALENVVRVAPDYPGAASLLAAARQQVDEQMLSRPSIKPLTPSMPVAPPPELPEIYETAASTPEPVYPPIAALDAEPEPPVFGQLEAEPDEPQEQRSLIAPLLAAIVIVALIIVAVIALTQPGDQPVEPTAVSQVATTEATLPAVVATVEVTEAVAEMTAEAAAATDEPESTPEVEVSATLEVIAEITPEATTEATPEAEMIDDALAEALAPFTLADAGVETVETALGDTVIASVCATPGREVRQLSAQVMNALASVNDELEGDALGVRFIHCAGDGADLLVIGAPLDDARAYADGELTDAEFSQRWQPIQL